MKKRPVRVAKLLTLKSKRANPIISVAKRLIKIKIIISQSLDQQLAEHIEVAKVHNGTLLLIVDSPVWATRIRYMQDEIINGLKNYAITKSIYNVSIKVRPAPSTPRKKERPKSPASISQESARLMVEEINSISDPELKLALLRITKHAT